MHEIKTKFNGNPQNMIQNIFLQLNSIQSFWNSKPQTGCLKRENRVSRGMFSDDSERKKERGSAERVINYFSYCLRVSFFHVNDTCWESRESSATLPVENLLILHKEKRWGFLMAFFRLKSQIIWLLFLAGLR